MVALPARERAPRHSILLLEDDPDLADLYSAVLEQAGFAVEVAENGRRGLEYLRQGSPDLIVSDIMMPEMDGLAFLRAVRLDSSLRFLPVIMLTTRSNIEDVVAGFAIGADDYLPKPIDPRELVIRVRARIDRPPVPADTIRNDAKSGLLNEKGFVEAMRAEFERAKRGGYPCALVRLQIYELNRLREWYGLRAEAALARTFGQMLAEWLRSLELAARAEDGSYLVFLPDTNKGEVTRRLDALMREVVHTKIEIGTDTFSITPVSGYAMSSVTSTIEALLAQSDAALAQAAAHLDLRPVAYEKAMLIAPPKPRFQLPVKKIKEALRLPAQMAATYAIGLGGPFVAYVFFGTFLFDISPFVYWGAVICMVLTCLLIWWEAFLSLKKIHPPELPDRDFGPVSAIIAAYLPNEAATLESTIQAFLDMDYPAQTQIILAYNTPVDMPIEKRLRDISREDPRFVPLRVEGSTSKAQNVNAALSQVTSSVVSIYDADHHPDPDSFRRAWRWIADGADVVQGHCLIRNGDASWVARTVAVEFEQIYAVAHSGRARLHRFGIFGGSNGFWRTDLLREIRMRGSMLTEDIDSSIRAVQRGKRIVSDRFLVSRELAPTTLKSLTNQRLRWAQGWFQVALLQTWPSLRAAGMTWRQRIGMFHLLMWREAFPWLSIQIFPIMGYYYYQYGTLSTIDWFHHILMWVTLFVFLTGPGQLIFTWRNADPEIKRRKRWFWSYLFVSVFFYAGYKNLLARVANMKEVYGEKAWKITPRR